MKPLTLFAALLPAACVAAPSAAPSAGLAGKWQVQEADSAAMPEGVSITLLADGYFHTDGGCNRLFGRYRQSGNRLIFSDAASTLKACADGQHMEIDSRLGTAVGTHRTYRISGTQLEWFNDNGKVVLKAVKSEP
ncbi:MULTISPECIES: META domain-containing protein [unclassified Neisseria]|uniref:META domain-containing protein n=1 Tax=unclassified Neisseria TaxID=2623750 RepID=UPI00143003EA|nr:MULTISPECIES: META domain-containing protein [unclassified Neisseria]MBF0803666.1 META domain-containing protein [Neisseria sp. 19428wB4_WF04]